MAAASEVRVLYPARDRQARDRIGRNAIKNGLPESEVRLLQEYITWRTATKHVGDKRQHKIFYTILSFRQKYMPANFCEMSSADVFRAVDDLLGSELKQNTKSDTMTIMKAFWKWLIKSGRWTQVTLEELDEIKVPPQQWITHAPEDLLTDEEVYRMIDHPNCNARDAALIAILRWTGARVGEVLSLRWKDISFGDQILDFRITDTKKNQTRFSPAAEPLIYVAAWRRKYPVAAGKPEGENFVFVTLQGKQGKKRVEDTEEMASMESASSELFRQMTWAAAAKAIKSRAKDAGITRRIHAHLFRATDITQSAVSGEPDAVNKMRHFGTQNTMRMKTYLLLNDTQIRDAMKRRAGLKTDEEKKSVGPRQCSYCFSLNSPNDDYCRKCGRAISEHAQEKQTVMNGGFWERKDAGVDVLIAEVAKRAGLSSEQLLLSLSKMK